MTKFSLKNKRSGMIDSSYPLVLALGGFKQANCWEFEVSTVYKVTSRSAKVIL